MVLDRVVAGASTGTQAQTATRRQPPIGQPAREGARHTCVKASLRHDRLAVARGHAPDRDFGAIVIGANGAFGAAAAAQALRG